MKITIEHLEFPLSVKDKITKIPKISKLHLDFISGKNIHFDKTNLSIKEPHKIIISNESSCLILISYEDDNNLYVKDSHEIMTLSRLSDLVLKMWKMKKIEKILNFYFSLFYKGLRAVLGYNFQKRAVACPKKMWYYGNIRQLSIGIFFSRIYGV